MLTQGGDKARKTRRVWPWATVFSPYRAPEDDESSPGSSLQRRGRTEERRRGETRQGDWERSATVVAIRANCIANSFRGLQRGEDYRPRFWFLATARKTRLLPATRRRHFVAGVENFFRHNRSVKRSIFSLCQTHSL
jgi:hypothetical protein